MQTCCICAMKGKHVYNFEHILADLKIEGTCAHVACIQDARAKFYKAAEAQGASRRSGFRVSQVRRSPHCTG